MCNGWEGTRLTTEVGALEALMELSGKRWLCRGQSRRYDGLVPSIDRSPRQNLPREAILTLERRSINCFRSTARFFADPGEQGSLTDDVVALMVLRHYGVPTRLLDWSLSPWVAAFFAASGHDEEEGEIWTFDEPLYEHEGAKQWMRWPQTTTDGSGDGSKFSAALTAFALEEPPDWFICGFYNPGFHRQNAQAGAYTMTARFGRDHAASIAGLLANSSSFHLYVVAATLKPTLRRILREAHGIWRGSLFPDSAGAADTVKSLFQTKAANPANAANRLRAG
jgi:hypothetical protein